MDVVQENIILQYSAVYAGLTKFNALQGSIESSWLAVAV